MRKQIFIMLTFSLLLCGILSSANAAELHNTSGSCGQNLTWELTDSTLTIRGKGEMENPEMALEEIPWFDVSESIREVVIEPGVSSIANQAFSICKNLTNIQIPDSVTNIGHAAFYECTRLKSITLPANLSTIVSSTFWGCSSLTSVYIPYGVDRIEDFAFYACENLASIDIPDSVAHIGLNAFEGCRGLKNLILPEGLLLIEKAAFVGCSSLSSVTLPDSLKYIEPSAFAECSKLSSVTVPSSLVSIGFNAFSGCNSLSDVYYAGSKSQWKAISIGYENQPLATATIHYSNPGSVTFTDVSTSSWYAEPVAWAVERDIANGTSPTTFSPDATCTNAQVLTFIWRAYGGPEPTINNPFGDITVGQYYYKPALWAYENAMVTGSAFEPDKPCTRRMAVTYLWKANGSPTTPLTSRFTDVNANSSYAQAIAWAVEMEIADGTGNSTFSPETTCTRAHIITFLYRDFSKKPSISVPFIPTITLPMG